LSGLAAQAASHLERGDLIDIDALLPVCGNKASNRWSRAPIVAGCGLISVIAAVVRTCLSEPDTH
jgi:hypothetical protein